MSNSHTMTTPKRALLLCMLALVLAASATAGSIERDVTLSENGLDITLTVTDPPVGGIVETLPDGCTWVETNHPADRTRVSGQHVAFAVIGEETIQYRVQGPSEAAEGFAGIWEAYNTLAGASGTVGDDEPQTPESETTQNSGLMTAEAETVPCDLDDDGTVTASELAMAILDSLDARFMGGTGEAQSLVDLQNAAFVYKHWDGQALTITDSAGQTTTVYRPLRRVVIFNANNLRAMRVLDVELDRIVGVTNTVHNDPVYFHEYQETPDMGSLSSPNYEQVLLVHPDAVFFYASTSVIASNEIEKKLGSIEPGIRFFRFDCYRPMTYADEVRILGHLLGKEEEADRFLAFYEDVTDTVAEGIEKIPDEDRVQVYVERTGDYSSAGNMAGYQEKIELAGGKNIFADSSTDTMTVDPEEVIIRNPDVIFKVISHGAGSHGGGYSNDDDRLASEMVHRSIMSRPGWDQINSVRDGRVHLIHNDIIGGADNFIGIAYLAKWFYPDLFSDLDPRAIHQQYLTEFQRLDYDLDEHPEFVYPT
jgi:iron complex transport system substrate-binding protein